MAGTSSLPHDADPSAIAKRLMQRAHNRDGLPEITVGLTFVVVASLVTTAPVALSIVIPVMCLGAPSALKWVRHRFLLSTYGYVEPNPIDRKQIGVGILLACVMTTVLFGIVPRLSEPDRWLLGGTGVFGGALEAWAGRLPRFVVGGAMMAAAGLYLAFSGVSLPGGFAILFGLQGLVTLVAGTFVFLKFLRG